MQAGDLVAGIRCREIYFVGRFRIGVLLLHILLYGGVWHDSEIGFEGHLLLDLEDVPIG